MMIDQLTGILIILGLTLLRFGVPVVLTWGFCCGLRRVVDATDPGTA